MGNSRQALHSTWYLELRCWKEGLSLWKRNPRTQEAQGFWFSGPPYCKWPGFLTASFSTGDSLVLEIGGPEDPLRSSLNLSIFRAGGEASLTGPKSRCPLQNVVKEKKSHPAHPPQPASPSPFYPFHTCTSGRADSGEGIAFFFKLLPVYSLLTGG